MEKQELEKEREKLAKTLKIIEEILLNERSDLNELYDEHIGNREDLWRIAESKKIHIKNLEASLYNPYFARIDFIPDDAEEISSIYIGKNGIMKDDKVVVTDWRAPISSLYYDAEVGNCSYEAPEGIINGNMSLKRQYEIEKGKLNEYFDVDLVSNDALLQKYLNGNNDARLKSIVSTIQKEQNDVIRKSMADNLIIQGVAGSGKTTVALHRIAYLVYNYIKSIKQNQYLIIGPNPVFIKYIKSVLPELDVSNVEQLTFEEFAKRYINQAIEINSAEKKVNLSISRKLVNNVDKFKSSLKYKNMIEKFLNIYLESIFSSDLKIDDFVVLKRQEIKNVYEMTNKNYNNDFKSRIEITIARLCSIIEDKKDELISKFIDYNFEIVKNISNENKDEIRSKIQKNRTELDKNCKNLLKKYFSKAFIEPTKLYKLFISSINDYNIYNYDKIDILKKETLDNIRKNKYEFEDLSALMYIKSIISPNKDYLNIRHVVLDEAQDFGEFNFFILKKVLSSSTFSIFGDLAQSIYDYRSVDNWEKVNEIMFNNTGKIMSFNKSYRTTREIMSVADEVANSIGLASSEMVIRKGKPVNFTHIEEDNIPKYIIEKIKEFKDKGYKSIAIISKTNLLSSYINDDLNDNGLIIPNVTINDDMSEDKFNICTISNQLAKGLEFDAVIINNANEKIYSSNSQLDMKLLYVAITRALHELDIVYSDKLTNTLEKHLKKDRNI